MGKLFFRLYIFIMLSIVMFNLLYMFSKGILTKNPQIIILYSIIISILFSIVLTWMIDLVINIDIKFDELEYEIEELKRKINLSDNKD